MKLIIDIPEEVLKTRYYTDYFGCGSHKLTETLDNGTPIPDNATNGDVMKAMFDVKEIDMCNTYCVYFPEEDCSHYFFKGWWNAPYQKEDKNE